jgi:hypothetical protein
MFKIDFNNYSVPLAKCILDCGAGRCVISARFLYCRPHALPDNLEYQFGALRIDIVSNSSNRCGRMYLPAGDEVPTTRSR